MVNSGEALRSLWSGTCTVIVRQGVQNQLNKRMEFTEKVIYQNVPCKLSFKLLYKTLLSTGEDSKVAPVKQVAKLFIAADLAIPPGSKITVTQNGKTVDYEKSGQPSFYTNHQEVPLELFKGWA